MMQISPSAHFGRKRSLTKSQLLDMSRNKEALQIRRCCSNVDKLETWSRDMRDHRSTSSIEAIIRRDERARCESARQHSRRTFATFPSTRRYTFAQKNRGEGRNSQPPLGATPGRATRPGNGKRRDGTYRSCVRATRSRDLPCARAGSCHEDAESENAAAQLLFNVALFEQPRIATI